jgi:hypothetical protein
MRSPRGVILLAVMLALGVLTLAAVPLMAGESTLPRPSSDASAPTTTTAALAHCQRLVVRQARQGRLSSGPLGAQCSVQKIVERPTGSLWHVATSPVSSGALEVWVVAGEAPRRVHVRPVPR